VLDPSARPQYLAARTAQQVVLGVVPEPPQRYSAADRFGLGGDDGIDAAPFEIAVDLAVGVAGICGDGLHFSASGRCGGIDPFDHHLAFVRLAGRDLDIDDDAAQIIDSRVLLVGRFEAAISAICRHRGVRVGNAHFLKAAGLTALFLGQLIRSRVAVYLVHRLDMANREALPAHIRPDKRGIDVQNLARGDLGRDTRLHGALKDLPKSLDAPALADAG
jgi:hypothetical protein